MVQTVALKTFAGGVQPIAPTLVTLLADQGVVAGATCVAALPRVQFMMVWIFIKWKAVGTVLTSVVPRFADNAALTTNPVNGVSFTFANGPSLINTNQVIQHWTDFTTGTPAVPTNAQVGLFETGTVTGTFTVDIRYEFYPIQ